MGNISLKRFENIVILKVRSMDSLYKAVFPYVHLPFLFVLIYENIKIVFH